MARASGPAQRDHAPVAVIILFDEMLDPFGAREIRHVGGEPRRIEIERQSQAVGERRAHTQLYREYNIYSILTL